MPHVRASLLRWQDRAEVLRLCARGAGVAERPVLTVLYVDDPLIAVLGNPAQRARRMALIVLVWRALGFPLAFHKAARGQRVHWIVCTLSLSTLPTTTISAEIREEKIEECRSLVAATSAKNVLTARELRKALGLWRPFLSEMWAALAAGSGGRIWVKQFTGALTWLVSIRAP